MQILQLGYYKLKEIQDFFKVKFKSDFSKNKEKYLNMLKEYCNYEIKYGKDNRVLGLTISEIYDEGPYESKKDLRAQVEKFVDEEWGKYDDPAHTADSLTIVTNRYCAQHEIVWQLPKYIIDYVSYIDEATQTKRKNIEQKIHNPNMKKWWQVYGIIQRHFLKDNKTSKRLFLETFDNRLACRRLTEEKEQIIRELSKQYFGTTGAIPYQIREVVEAFSENGMISEETFYEILPIAKEIAQKNKWEAFVEDCASHGIEDVIKGCDRTEDAANELTSDVKDRSKAAS